MCCAWNPERWNSPRLRDEKCDAGTTSHDLTNMQAQGVNVTDDRIVLDR